jgi:2,5-diamino-6-(ribosylamino)-4(3H)-pyrimidinone 5'-phosphate reductase
MVAINMVSTVDGKAAVAGKGGGIGSRFDRTVMDRIRSWFDLVLWGSGTLRAEGYGPVVKLDVSRQRALRGLRPRPIGAVVTSSGLLPLEARFWSHSGLDRVIFTSERGVLAHTTEFESLAKLARVVVVGEERVDLEEMARFARTQMSVERLLVEGGPALNQALFAHDLVDELFLTVAPRVVGGRSLTIVDDASQPVLDFHKLELLSGSARESEIYLRYRVRRD